MQDNYEEIKPKTFSFGVPADYIMGTLMSITKSTSPDKYGKYSNIYQIKVKEGSFYRSTKNEKTGKLKLDETPTVISSGEDYNLWVNHDKGVLIGAMKGIQVGQKFKALFVEEKPTDKGNPAKIIKVFAGKDAQGLPLMDKEWQDSLLTEDEKEIRDFEDK